MARRQLRHKERKPLIVICVEGEKNSTEYNYFRHYNIDVIETDKDLSEYED